MEYDLHPLQPASTRTGGFSLIEVLIVVVIIGLLAAIAVPSYTGYLERSRRTDATSFLLEVAGEQQKFFSENNQYAAGMDDLNYGNADTFDTPEGGYYTVSIDVPDPALSFTLTATPKADGAQANDTDCGSFTLTSAGIKSVSTGSDKCW